MRCLSSFLHSLNFWRSSCHSSSDGHLISFFKTSTNAFTILCRNLISIYGWKWKRAERSVMVGYSQSQKRVIIHTISTCKSSGFGLLGFSISFLIAFLLLLSLFSWYSLTICVLFNLIPDFPKNVCLHHFFQWNDDLQSIIKTSLHTFALQHHLKLMRKNEQIKWNYQPDNYQPAAMV